MSYQPQAIDTSEASDRVFFQLLRSRSSQQRLQMAASMIRNARRFSLSALRQTFPQMSPTAFARHVALAWLQADCPAEFSPPLSDRQMLIQAYLPFAEHALALKTLIELASR